MYRVWDLAEALQLLVFTRIMVYKGMVYMGKYWISEKNKGIPVSIFGHF